MDMLLNQMIVQLESCQRRREADQQRLAQSLASMQPRGLHALEAWLGKRLLAMSRRLLTLAGEDEGERGWPRLPSPT